MLKHLKQADIDAVLAACRAQQSATGAETAEPSPGHDRLYEIIESLSMDAQDELLALMWTGGPKNQNSFEENLELVQKTIDDNHAFHLAEQSANLPSLLANGLKKVPNIGESQ
jgi:hypothetical protein